MVRLNESGIIRDCANQDCALLEEAISGLMGNYALNVSPGTEVVATYIASEKKLDIVPVEGGEVNMVESLYALKSPSSTPRATKLELPQGFECVVHYRG